MRRRATGQWNCAALVLLAAALGDEVSASPESRQARRSFDRGAELEARAANSLKAGDKRTAASQLSKALSAYRSALSKAPHDPDPALRMGTILLFESRCEDAIPILERTARLAFNVDLEAPNGPSGAQVEARRKLRELLLLVGRCRLATGPDDRGFRILEAVSDPAPEVQFLLGRRYLEAGRSRPALKHLSAYLEHNGKDLKARKAVANLQLRLDRLTDAAASYRQILASSPEDLNALKNLAVVEVRRGRYPEAIRSLTRVLKQLPNDLQARFNLGVCWARMGEHGKAVAQLQKAVALKPALARGWHRLGVSFAALKKNRQAVDALQRAVHYAPDNISSHLALARVHRHNGDTHRCATVLEKILKRSPQEPRILVELGDCLRDQGNASRALEVHQRAAEIEPRNPAIQVALAEDLHRVGRLDDAVAAYRRAMALEKSRTGAIRTTLSDVLGKLGARAIKNKAFDVAVDRLSEAVRQSQPNPVHLANLGVALMGLGRYDEADQHLATAYKQNSGHPGIRSAYAQLLLGRRRAKEAVAVLESGRPNAKTEGHALRLLGLAYLRSGAVTKAVSTLRTAVAAQPDNRGTQYDLGTALVRAGKYREAAKLFKDLPSKGDVSPKVVRLAAGYAAYQTGDYGRAAELIAASKRRSKAAMTLRAAAWSRAGEDLATKKQFRLARSAFEKARKASDGLAVQANVAAVEYELGETRAAYQVWRRMARKPVPPPVYHNIAIYLDDEADNELAAYQWYRKYERMIPKRRRRRIRTLVARKKALFGF